MTVCESAEAAKFRNRWRETIGNPADVTLSSRANQIFENIVKKTMVTQTLGFYGLRKNVLFLKIMRSRIPCCLGLDAQCVVLPGVPASGVYVGGADRNERRYRRENYDCLVTY